MGKSISEKFLSFYEEHAKGPCGRTLELLEDWRVENMLYSYHEETEYGGGYLMDALIGTEGTLGVEVAATLSVMMPAREEGEETQMILITDYPNLDQMPDFMVKSKNRWRVKNNTTYATMREIVYVDKDMIAAFEDERYLIILSRVAWSKDILMNIYKK